MADEVRLIDANSVCKKIVESIHCAEKWANEAKERQDTHGLRCAAEAITSLLAMFTRIHDEPTIEAEPDKGWISVKDRLPPYGERVLVINEAYEAERGYTKYNCGVTVRDPHLNFTFWGHKITHWQPLPKPPKGE